MRSKTSSFAIVLGMLLYAATSLTQAQTTTTEGAAAKKQARPYRLDFSINELESGKILNTRHYSMYLTEGDRQHLKIGTRVPVHTEEGKMQYIDVGTSISAHIADWNTPPTLDVSADISSFATPDNARPESSAPLLRQMQISGDTAMFPGKPMTIGTVDDPNSNRSFQLVVTATKLD